GGNHEAANHLWELYYGGWAAPNIFFLGFTGVVRFGGVRIAGLSGIYAKGDYMKGHHERLPYDSSTMRSMYHVRDFEAYRLMQIQQPLDIFLSHDWPRNIVHHGDKEALLRRKTFLRSEIESSELGSPASEQLLKALQPSYWFSAHMHTKFPAVVEHAGGKATRFLALDKCLPGRDFLQVIGMRYRSQGPVAVLRDQVLELEAEGPKVFEYDPEWLAILRSTHSQMNLSRQHRQVASGPLPYMGTRRMGPSHADMEFVEQTEALLQLLQLPYSLDHANPPKPTASSQGPMAAQNPSQAAQDGRGGNLATPSPPPLMLANPEEIELGDFDDADSGLTTQPTEGGGAASSAGRGVEKMMAANPEEIDLEDDAEGSQGGDEPAALSHCNQTSVDLGVRNNNGAVYKAKSMQFPTGVVGLLPHSNVYVKGLPPDCTEATLLALFSAHGSVMSARVFQQPNKPPFAFVKFNSVAEATQAILALNGVVLGTSMLEVRFADSDIGSHTERVAPPSDNVFIRGFAPGSSENDLRMLFSPYGLVISARILHHGEQSGQGAAGLVRMASMEEAGRAVLALNGQRLQGCASTLVARFADSLEIKARKQAKQPLGPNQVLLQATSPFRMHSTLPMSLGGMPMYARPNSMLVQQPMDLMAQNMMGPMPSMLMGSGKCLPATGWNMPTGPTYSMPQLPSVSLPPETAMVTRRALDQTNTPRPYQRAKAELLHTLLGFTLLLQHCCLAPHCCLAAVSLYATQSLPQQSSMGPLHFEASTPTNSMGMAGSSGSTGVAGMLLPNGGSSLGTPALPAPTTPLQRTSLFVSNMPPDAGKLLLYETFAPYGAIHSVEQVLEDSSASEGDRKCGLVSFVHADAAARAMAALHKQPPTASGQLLNLEVQTK
ncbi:hypothetical protein QJQ45_017337, partial [Haematococcus lacustris]